MKPETADRVFLNFLKQTGLELATLRPAEGIRAMLDFYSSERAEGCALEEDGDMLLYEWSTYKGGDGDWFRLDITRQLMSDEGEDDDIRQLGLTFKYEPSPALRILDSGNRWCYSLAGLPEFMAFLQSQPAYVSLANTQASVVMLDF